MSDCTRKTIFGNPACYFQPRYDMGPSQLSMGSVEGSRAGVIEAMEKYRQVIYVPDVCVRCGKTIERQNP